MSKSKISISIVTYNNEGIIEDTIKSILEAIPENFKYDFFVIDNSSIDKTPEILSKYNEIQYIKSINKGFGYGHNRVKDLLDSKYHFVVNPDIHIIDNDFFQKCIDILDNDTSIGLISPLILNPDMTIQYLNKKNPTFFDMAIRFVSPNLFKKRQDRYVMKDFGYDKTYQLEYASGCFMIFRTKVFKEINGFDESFFMYLEDADITRRVNQISKAIFTPNIRVVHLWERSGHKKIKYMIITLKSMIIYFKKWRRAK